jgi:hypothetical protein
MKAEAVPLGSRLIEQEAALRGYGDQPAHHHHNYGCPRQVRKVPMATLQARLEMKRPPTEAALLHSAGSFAVSQSFMSAAMRSCPAFLMASDRFDPGGSFFGISQSFGCPGVPVVITGTARLLHSFYPYSGGFSSPESQPRVSDPMGSLGMMIV